MPARRRAGEAIKVGAKEAVISASARIDSNASNAPAATPHRREPAGSAADAALLALLAYLQDLDYAFVTPTPETHARVVARPTMRRGRTITDILGWSRPFRRGSIDPQIEHLLQAADMLRIDGEEGAALIRVSRLGGILFLHSAYPTLAADAVFFGPDSYRFAGLIRAELANWHRSPRARILDIGTGSGVGAIFAAGLLPDADIVMTDVNGQALRLAGINAAAAGARVQPWQRPDLDGLGLFDIVMANPPYIIDDSARAYRDGGDLHGGRVSLDMARMALAHLAPGGRLILYSGSAITAGEDGLGRELAKAARAAGCSLRYWEIDPDVFGEELAKPAYDDVDRIAVIAAIIDRPA